MPEVGIYNIEESPDMRHGGWGYSFKNWDGERIQLFTQIKEISCPLAYINLDGDLKKQYDENKNVIKNI